MIQIFFYSPDGYEPIKAIRNLLRGSHGWSVDSAVFGVAEPALGVHPCEVVDALTAMGVKVLPSVYDNTPIPANVATALSQYGVLPTHTTHECATQMHGHCGMPHLRPHRY